MAMFPDCASAEGPNDASPRAGRLYPLVKRGFDFAFCALVLAPAALAVAATLLALNPLLNPGPLLYRPVRMGRHCRPFRAWKFRTMRPDAGGRPRGPEEPLETDRITALGRVLRRSRFDELPQILNVFRGEMSLIGPRPDDYRHARAIHRGDPRLPPALRRAPRHLGPRADRASAMRAAPQATRLKTEIDLRYLAEAGPALEARIFWGTIRAVANLQGR
jgi:lipopolysaccharide/colanic/teichoic acid biosynthesis glycosyltransferase